MNCVIRHNVIINGNKYDVKYIIVANEGKFVANEKDCSSCLKDKIKYPFAKVKRAIKRTFYKIKHGVQRIYKGYDDFDVIETYDTFIEKYYKILTEHKNSSSGFPFRYTEDEWETILDKMTKSLYYMSENNLDKELMANVPKNWIPDFKSVSLIMEYNKTEFFKLFEENFYDLWI